MTVTHFNADTLIEEHKTYDTDYIRYHLHYSYSKYHDRLRRLVNEGKIIEYLDDDRSGECSINMTRKVIFECMVYI